MPRLTSEERLEEDTLLARALPCRQRNTVHIKEKLAVDKHLHLSICSTRRVIEPTVLVDGDPFPDGPYVMV